MNIDVITHGGGATEAQIREVETKIGAKLPDDYREFLLQYNGGRVRMKNKDAEFDVKWTGDTFGYQTTSIAYLYALSGNANISWRSAYSSLVEIQRRIPENTTPIGYDPAANEILLGFGKENRGKVYLWLKDYAAAEDDAVPNYSNVGLVANSFSEFLQNLRPQQ